MLELTVCFDFVCPFCYLEHEALKQVQREAEFDLNIRYLPFELRRPPTPKTDPMHDEAKLHRFNEVLLPAAKRLGVEMKLPFISPHPYTTLAMQGLHYALEEGCVEAYIDRLFRAFYVEEQDIGDPAMLADLAEQVGLSRSRLLEIWQGDIYIDRLDEEKALAREMGVSAIPALFVNGQLVTDPETPDGLRTAFRTALAAERSADQSTDRSGKRTKKADPSDPPSVQAVPFCGEDGCNFG